MQTVEKPVLRLRLLEVPSKQFPNANVLSGFIGYEVQKVQPQVDRHFIGVKMHCSFLVCLLSEDSISRYLQVNNYI